MPNFDFLCTCGNVYERFFEFGTAPRKVPCICGKLAERQIHFPMIYLRGPGFSTSGDFYDADTTEPAAKDSTQEERIAYREHKEKESEGRMKRIKYNLNPPCPPAKNAARKKSKRSTSVNTLRLAAKGNTSKRSANAASNGKNP